MILHINTSDEIGMVSLNNLENGHVIVAREIEDGKSFSEEILKKIDELDSNLFSDNRLKAIIVNIGPGSYTGLRIGVTVANFLALSGNAPVYGYKKAEFDTVRKIILQDISDKKFSSPVLPFYSNPPNITKPKSGR